MMTVLELRSVSKSYRSDFLFRRMPALTDVTFDVAAGETFAYLGHNGAGKTTTIKSLLGLIRVDAGNIRVFGHAPGTMAAKRRLGYLPENPYFYDHLTAREFLHLAARLNDMNRSDAKHRADQLLALVKMDHKANVRLRNFSKGMLQRVGLAQALIGDPELLVLDEPMGGLDPVGRYEVRRILEELKSRGKTLFMSSHILADVETLADRAAILNGGTLRRLVDLHELGHQERIMDLKFTQLSEAMVGELVRRGYPVERRAEAHHVLVEEHFAMAGLIDELVRSGSRLLRAAPHRVSLEEIFLREVERDVGQTPEDLLHRTVDELVGATSVKEESTP